jgi:hypothetical protein
MSEMHDGPLTQAERDLWSEMGAPVMKRLEAFQQVLAHFSDDDWKSSLMWEALENAKNNLVRDIEDIMNLPGKPADFVHWRKTHAKPGTVL